MSYSPEDLKLLKACTKLVQAIYEKNKNKALDACKIRSYVDDEGVTDQKLIDLWESAESEAIEEGLTLPEKEEEEKPKGLFHQIFGS